MAPVVCPYWKLFLAHPEDVRAWLTVQNPTDGARSSCEGDLNEAARAADASREAKGAVYGERLK